MKKSKIFTKNWFFSKLGQISKIRPTTAQKMLLFKTGKKFSPIDNNLRVQTLDSVKHVHILKLLFSQAVTVTGVPADGYELTHYLRNIISFDCIYGFDRLQSRITWFFHWFWWLVGDTVFTRAGPLNSAFWLTSINND